MRRVLPILAVLLAAGLASVLTADAVAVDSARETSEGNGTLRVEVTDERTGEPLAARVVVAPDALFAPTRTLVDRRGMLRASLVAGRYELSVTHGPEWSVSTQRVDVIEGDVSVVRASLSRLVDASAYTACELHVHTSESPDADLALGERTDTLLAEDVHFAVITDHNHVTEAAATLAAAGIGSLPGVEVTTWAPEFGHFNAFPRATAPQHAHSSARALLRELRQVPGAFVQINHPRLEHHIGYFELASFDRTRPLHDETEYPLSFDAVEVWNGYDLAAPSRRDEVFRDWLALLARGHRVTATGGSDSHRAGRSPYTGYPRTYVYVPRTRAQESGTVLAALKQGRSFVTNGPLLELHVRGHAVGDTLRLRQGERHVRVHVDVLAPAWMALSEVEVWSGEELAAAEPLPARAREGRASRQRVSLQIPVAPGSALVATVRGTASLKPLLGRTGITPYAFTNPIWISGT